MDPQLLLKQNCSVQLELEGSEALMQWLLITLINRRMDE